MRQRVMWLEEQERREQARIVKSAIRSKNEKSVQSMRKMMTKSSVLGSDKASSKSPRKDA